MANAKKVTEVSFDKYYPQHPLPKEIQNMSANETVCEFCGISYLIHNEIRRLEEEILNLNLRIQCFEEMEINYKKNKEQTNILNAEMDGLRKTVSFLEEKNNSFKQDRDLFFTDAAEKADKIIQLELLISILNDDKSTLLKNKMTTYQNLFDAKRKVQEMKDELMNMKKEISSLFGNTFKQNSATKSSIFNLLNQIGDYRSEEYNEKVRDVFQLKSEIARLTSEFDEQVQQNFVDAEKNKRAAEKNTQLLQEQIKLQHDVNESLRQITEKDGIISLLRKEIDDQKAQNQKDSNQTRLEISVLAEQNKRLESVNEKEKLKNDSLQLQFEKEKEEKSALLNDKINYEKEIDTYKDEIKTMKVKYDELRKTAELTQSEKDSIIESLQERNQMLENQLKASELKTEKLRIDMEAKFEEAKLKFENDIAVIREGNAKYKNMERVLKDQKNALQTTQQRVTELSSENQRLLLMIDNLENTIKTLEDSTKIQAERKNSLVELENEIQEKENLIDKMEADIIKNNKEIESLKLTIQKECEERQELSEALQKAREQLLVMGDYHTQKFPTSLPPIQHAPSNASSASQRTNNSQNRISNLPSHRRTSSDKSNPRMSNSIITAKRNLEKLFN